MLPEPSDDENDMLDMAFGLTDTSRLGCQVGFLVLLMFFFSRLFGKGGGEVALVWEVSRVWITDDTCSL